MVPQLRLLSNLDFRFDRWLLIHCSMVTIIGKKCLEAANDRYIGDPKGAVKE